MDKRPHFQLNSRTAWSSLPISASRTPYLPSICFISFFVTFFFSASVPRRHQFPSVRHLFRGLHSESTPLLSRRCNEAHTDSRPLLYITPYHSMSRRFPIYGHRLLRPARRSLNINTRAMAETHTSSNREPTRATCSADTDSS